MNVTLKPELRKFINDQVQSGRFNSVADAINAAVARLQTERDLASPPLDALRTEIDLGLAEADRGVFVEFTADDVISNKRAARASNRRKEA